MRIWIDGYEANVLQRVGSGQVAFELLKNIEQIDSKNEYTILLPSEPLSDMPRERSGFVYRILKPKRLWTRIALPLSLYFSKDRPDIFFSPTHYTPKFSPVKRVMMVFDLAYLHYPQFFKKSDLYKLSKWTEESVRNAEKIITISQNSKQDIVKFYKISKDLIKVCYPGKNDDLYKVIEDAKDIEKVKSKYNIVGRYIIFVSTIQPRKNLARLIEAFKNIDDLRLVVVGKTSGEGRSGWMFEDILALPKKLQIEDRVVFTGFVPDEDLPFLINGAVAYIQPSLYEGFGIPALEAMNCGVPALVSNNSSLSEVVGKAGLLFDPNSVVQIEQAIRTISTDNKLREKLSILSLEQAKKFSWKKMAKEVIEVFESIL